MEADTSAEPAQDRWKVVLSGGPLEALCWVGRKWAGLGASTEAGEGGSVGLVRAPGCSGALGS